VYRFVVLLMLAFSPLSGRADPATILVFGDSISAGFGLASVASGWVALLQTKLDTAGYGYRVVNASVSGETTAGGLARIPRALSVHRPQIVVLELGGNDGLRALPVANMRANLAEMVRLARASGAAVLLLGIRIPPNYGPEYTQEFFDSYAVVARDLHVPVVPFLLDGIALSPELMQADGIHPDEQGQGRLVANVWPALQPLLAKPGTAARAK
jgi:acyl-CoA thioesterase-1